MSPHYANLTLAFVSAVRTGFCVKVLTLLLVYSFYHENVDNVPKDGASGKNFAAGAGARKSFKVFFGNVQTNVFPHQLAFFQILDKC